MTGTRLLVVVASALLVAACASSGSRLSSSESTAPTTTGTLGTTGTTFVPAPLPGGATDCGTFDLASGWPTTFVPSPTLYSCLDDAFRTGTLARLVLSAQTDGEGGAPVRTTYLVTGQGIVHVTVDATQAADRPRVVSTKDCRTLTASSPEPTVGNCENMDN